MTGQIHSFLGEYLWEKCAQKKREALAERSWPFVFPNSRHSNGHARGHHGVRGNRATVTQIRQLRPSSEEVTAFQAGKVRATRTGRSISRVPASAGYKSTLPCRRVDRPWSGRVARRVDLRHLCAVAGHGSPHGSLRRIAEPTIRAVARRFRAPSHQAHKMPLAPAGRLSAQRARIQGVAQLAEFRVWGAAVAGSWPATLTNTESRRSSVAERLVHTQEVRGAIPFGATINLGRE